MDSLPTSTLTLLQRETLAEFFARDQRFFLTGGAALAGYYLGHRLTDDLDLFTARPIIEEGRAALEGAARALGASLEVLSDSPSHKRFVLSRGTESLKIDLVHDPLQFLRKQTVGTVVLDSKEEIAANKLTILSRGAIRDLVDFMALEATGVVLKEAMELAMKKDAGVTPGHLAEVLSEIAIGDDASIPGGVSVPELRAYIDGLIDRMSILAFPEEREQ